MIRLSAFAAELSLVATLAFAEPLPVAWEDLIDRSALEYEDPYAAIGSENIVRLVKIDQLQSAMEGFVETDPRRAEAGAALEVLTGELAEQGLDADHLISQRWVVAERRAKAVTSGNPQLDGQEITIAGYAIPAPAEDDGTTIVYLVPERGISIHMPPPDANQMIRARLPGGWTVTAIHEPVRLTGRLTISPSEHQFRIVDVLLDMNATFEMKVARVETLAEMQAVSQ